MKLCVCESVLVMYCTIYRIKQYALLYSCSFSPQSFSESHWLYREEGYPGIHVPCNLLQLLWGPLSRSLGQPWSLLLYQFVMSGTPLKGDDQRGSRYRNHLNCSSQCGEAEAQLWASPECMSFSLCHEEWRPQPCRGNAFRPLLHSFSITQSLWP